MKIPPNLQIGSPEFPDANELLNFLISQSTSSDRGDASAARNHQVQMDPDALFQALIAIANQAWRIASTAIQAESKEPQESLTSQEIKKITNSLEKILSTMEDLGLRVIDRVGETFNEGFPDQVVTEEVREGISREQIIRTIRPTIMWQQTMVQRGEIDIAIPANPKND